ALDSNVATVSITVQHVNHAPDAVDDTLTTPENTAGSVNVLANDTDPDGDPLFVTTPTPTAPHGTGACAAFGLFAYTPNAGFFGTDSFAYTISDGNGGFDTATVHITVTQTNHAPVATDSTLTTDQDTPKDVTLQATDPDGDPLTFTIVGGPSHGTLSGTGATRAYTPNAGYVGPDSFTFKANDGALDSNVATVSIMVQHVNHAPDAVDDTLTTPENTAGSVNVLANDTDPDGDPLFVTTPTPTAAHGTVACAAFGLCAYTPNAGFFGTDSFAYTISDGNGGFDTATVHITVTQTNHAPVATDSTLTTDQDTPKDVTLQATDPDGDPLTFTIVGGPSHGTLSGTGATRAYTPNAGYVGPDSFTFKANDGALDSNVATVSITVQHVNHAPDAVDDTLTTPENTAGSVNVLAND